ncbi:lysylphosphatidylglycerol synthase transmembrane domain-containing protein [Olsenella sp. YH-ols2217]|uniref:Lysylphosphatidylglycerol synthase transmembrane domain-containing protein n=1 Tax=Kribbibacterium absianum TaxID=3044210 RepID=A0ABT6ZIE4_9ACTN|nr:MULTISPECIES: lysylphosphatidylglycerol synthase transmembrane domain-containing protein [unclassified Olsenella]MDJ1121325.1 lysylphosphatidylglycerol synthase transmembrane domain-containing protein [Olsenella sp. YH-ols2216]MDJ1128815.1 lysylphosphatidylglycerol synthase transmembrane domain-containing protein [Olsenella sp. YH-ols2217]
MTDEPTKAHEPQVTDDVGAANVGADKPGPVQVPAMDNEKKNKRDAVIGAVFMAVVLVGFGVYVVATGQSEQLWHALQGVQTGWVVAACAMMALYLGFGTLAFAIAAALDPKTPLGVMDLCAVEASGTFFGNLTPMMMGSVPAQIVVLVKEGLGAGEATALQLTRFLMYQVAEVALCGGLLAVSWGYFTEHYGSVVWLNFVLFAIKFAQFAVTLCVCLFPHWVRRLANRLLDWVEQKGFKRLAPHVPEWRVAVDSQVEQFASAFRGAVRHKRAMAAMFLASAAQLSILYGSPWFILMAFGRPTPFLIAITAGALVQFVSNSIPLPGGTGGIEAAFAVFFGPLFGTAATAAYLVWRLVTFYGYTVLCGVATTFRTKKGGKSVNKRLGRLA